VHAAGAEGKPGVASGPDPGERLSGGCAHRSISADGGPRSSAEESVRCRTPALGAGRSGVGRRGAEASSWRSGPRPFEWGPASRPGGGGSGGPRGRGRGGPSCRREPLEEPKGILRCLAGIGPGPRERSVQLGGIGHPPRGGLGLRAPDPPGPGLARPRATGADPDLETDRFRAPAGRPGLHDSRHVARSRRMLGLLVAGKETAGSQAAGASLSSRPRCVGQ